MQTSSLIKSKNGISIVRKNNDEDILKAKQDEVDIKFNNRKREKLLAEHEKRKEIEKQMRLERKLERKKKQEEEEKYIAKIKDLVERGIEDLNVFIAHFSSFLISYYLF